LFFKVDDWALGLAIYADCIIIVRAESIAMRKQVLEKFLKEYRQRFKSIGEKR
jgi:Na+-transporting NADH:ubiquinone oxidoreductase subunit NqrD